MIGMSVLLSKVDKCILFSSHRLLVVEKRKQKENVSVFLKIKQAQSLLLLRKNQRVGGAGNSCVIVPLVLSSVS